MDYFNKRIDLKFKNTLSEFDNITTSDFKKFYIVYFLRIITKEQFDIIKNKLTNDILIDWIANTSLCVPEYKYLYEIAQLNDDVDLDTFILNAKNIYKEIDNLKNCQLGNSMMVRLEI